MQTFKCSKCGDKFNANLDHGKPRKFCSRQCFIGDAIKPSEKNCQECDSVFTAKRSYKHIGHVKFCSKKCYHIYQSKEKITYLCECCGAIFAWSKSREIVGNIRFCSHTCQYEFMVGERASRWTGGETIHTQSGKVLIYIGHENHTALYKFRQRLVVENAIGRKLMRDEHIIYLNAILNDDRPENLYVGSVGYCRRIKNGREPYPKKSNLNEYR